jgi:hypothetical protein
MDTIADTDFSQHKVSYKKFWIHLTSSLTLSTTINFDSIVNLVIHIYLEDFHDIATLPSVKIYPLVDFKFLISDIQLASLYLYNIAR